MANKKVKIKLIGENCFPVKNNGNWYDCQSREMTIIRHGKEIETATNGIITVMPNDILMVKLGFAADMGKGYEAQVKPRSSTFKKYGILQGNSVGLIDDSYKGDGDEWSVYFHCTKMTRVPVNSRLVQMTIEKSRPDIDFDVVETLGNKNRGGFGTTGV